MKKLIFLLLSILPVYLMAQTEGVIEYQETVAFEIDLPEDMKEFAAQLPSSQKVKMNLFFNEEASLYETSKNNEDPQDLQMGSEDGGMQIKMKFDRPENKVYTNIAKGKVTRKEEFMGKKFLINSKVEKTKWKLTAESEKILGYHCQKATFQDSVRTTEVWFTPEIPISAGPQGISGLPGMVLKVVIDDGQTVLEAINVDLKKLDKGAIKAPKKGKKVTQEEFEKIREEKMKEMEAEYGGGGNRVIIRH